MLSRPVIIAIEHETTLVLSFIKGVVPAVCVLVVISLMFLALGGRIDIVASFILSFAIGLILLFLFGFFLGRVAKSNIWINALKTLMAGLLTLIVLFVVELLTGS